MAQLMPVPPGRSSDRVTVVAVPGPVFHTLMVKPIGLPALTDASSATFEMWSPGHSTVMEAESSTDGNVREHV